MVFMEEYRRFLGGVANLRGVTAMISCAIAGGTLGFVIARVAAVGAHVSSFPHGRPLPLVGVIAGAVDGLVVAILSASILISLTQKDNITRKMDLLIRELSNSLAGSGHASSSSGVTESD
jgi:hypothetical protein